jgi:thiaminase
MYTIRYSDEKIKRRSPVMTAYKDLSKEEEEQLIDIFIKSSLYEMDFWNMANK